MIITNRLECQKIREAYDKAHSEKKDGPILGTLEKAIKLIGIIIIIIIIITIVILIIIIIIIS